MRQFLIKSKENYDIHCVEYECKDPIGVLILVHGFGGSSLSDSITEVSKSMVRRGYSCIAYDSVGCGKSPLALIELTVTRALSDLGSVIDFARKKYKNLGVSLFGNSFGAYCILNFISIFGGKFENVILKSPAINMAGTAIRVLGRKISSILPEEKIFTKEKHPKQVSYTFCRELLKYDVYKNFERFKNFVYIFHGDADDLIDPSDIERFIKINPSKLTIIKGARHSFDDAQNKRLVCHIRKIFPKKKS